MTPDSFLYPALDPTLRSIRLVRLLARSSIDHAMVSYDIRCELTHRYLDCEDVGDRKRYSAVSYCWGTSSDQRQRTRKITMDGAPFMVSPIVEDILIRLHNPACDQLFWIDLISIDQNNISEKELQVSRMGDIFQQAFRVIASLGPHYNHAETHPLESALHFLRSQDVVEYDGGQSSHWETNLAYALTAKGISIEQYRTSSITHLLNHPWFRRVWIVQEMAFAKEVLVITGNQFLAGDVFAASLETYIAIADQNEISDEVRERKPLLRLMAAKQPLRPHQDLLSVLQDFRRWEATLAVDKVYALMGLCDPTWRIDVDYTAELPKVLLRAACFALLKSSSLDVLGCREPRPLVETHSAALPSWVPDWSKAHSSAERVMDQTTDLNTARGMTGPSKQEPTSKALHKARSKLITESRKAGILPVSGRTIATISTIFNDGSIEARWHGSTAARANSVYLSSSNLSRLAVHLEETHARIQGRGGSGLEANDRIAMLRGATGIAILRPAFTHQDILHCRLVEYQHSLFKIWGTIWDFVKSSKVQHIWKARYDELQPMVRNRLFQGRKFCLPPKRSSQDADDVFSQCLRAIDGCPLVVYHLI